MTDTVIINDTSAWHAGSAACVQSIRDELERIGHHVLGTVKTHGEAKSYPPLVVVNGEGSVHDDASHKAAKWCLGHIEAAKASGSTVWLVNSLWCRMTTAAAMTVRHCVDYFQVREPASRVAARDQGLDPVMMLDASVPVPVADAGAMRRGVATDASWNIRAGEWYPLLDELAKYQGLRTRYHHGVIAALISKTQFEYTEKRLNPTHKVTGLVDSLIMGDPVDWSAAWGRFDRMPRFSLQGAT